MIGFHCPYPGSNEEDDLEMEGIEDWVYPETRMVEG
jgi:hypothetical protein